MARSKLDDEAGRLSALQRLGVLDTGPEEQFDRIVQLVRSVFDVPIAAVSLIDRRRQWFKAQHGLPIRECDRKSAFCHHTIQQTGPLVVADAISDGRFYDSALVTGAPHIRAYAGVPLTTADGYNVGALCAIDTNPRTFTEAQIAMLADFAGLVADQLELRQIAMSDEVTSALSRRGFLAKAAAELDQVRRTGATASIIVIDIDHFKRVNDSHGHAAGDGVLRVVVARCAGAMRPGDEIGRLGGEEFGVLLPGAARRDASGIAERLRAIVDATPFPIGAETCVPVTISLGVAGAEGRASVDQWLNAADEALYAAKAAGRNRIVFSNAA